MRRRKLLGALLLVVSSCATTEAPGAASSSATGPSGNADEATTVSVGSDSAVIASPTLASSVLAPLPVPPEHAFVSNPAFPSCVHPGVKADCNDGWCRIPAGCFVYGSPESEFERARYDEKQASVPLSRDFEIQQTEVTQGEWLETGWPVPPAPEDVSFVHCEKPACPVNRTTWFWALRYANWMSEQHGLEPCFVFEGCRDSAEPTRDFSCEDATMQAATIYDCEGYRLPTSAEWEYAARAGTSTEFYSGAMEPNFRDISDCNLDPNLARAGWYCANIPDAGTRNRMEQPVALLPANAWGLYDVLGNVSEWAMDTELSLGWEDPYPDPEGQFEFLGPGTVRSCHFFSAASLCRVAQKLGIARDARWGGFRLARTLGPGNPPTLADVPSVGQAR